MESIKGVSSSALPDLLAANTGDYFPMLVVVTEYRFIGRRVLIIKTVEEFPVRIATVVVQTAIKPEEWEDKLGAIERVFSYGKRMEKEHKPPRS